VENENVIDIIKKLRQTSEPDWKLDCARTTTGALICNQANAVIALDALYPEAFAFDEMAQAPALLRCLDDSEAKFTPRAIRDADLSFLQNALQHVGFSRMGWDTVHRAVEVISNRARFHPVRKYLEVLAWDNTRRLDKFFPKYFGTADGPYENKSAPCS
jgi:predicted P-loop ATPase